MPNPLTLISSPKRILVTPLRFIGDVVLTIPMLRALRDHYPDAHIDVLTTKTIEPLLELCPYIDEVLIEPKSALALGSLIHQRRYDLSILCRRSLSQAILFKVAGVKVQIGFDQQRLPKPLNFKRLGWFLDTHTPFPAVTTHQAHVDVLFELLPLLGIPIQEQDRSLELWANEQDKLTVARLLNEAKNDANKPIALIHLSSASREKAMPIDAFVSAIQALHHHGFHCIAIGIQGEQHRYDALSTLSGVTMTNLCGKTTLRETFALLLQSQLIFSIDSAPIHMAAAADIPHIIGLYGPTNEHQWRPYPYHGAFTAITNTTLSCRPCEPKICSHNRCRTELTDTIIAQQLQHHLHTHLTPIKTGALSLEGS